MGSIRLVRVDFRLMHGQVITNWLNQVGANSIMIINDKLSNDPFMGNVYKMAAPKGVKVNIYSLQTALEKVNSEKYMASRDLIVIFKSVTDAAAASDAGFPIKALQIGGLGSGPDRIQITNQIFLNESDLDLLVNLKGKGVKVYLQAVPKEPELGIEKAQEKFSK